MCVDTHRKQNTPPTKPQNTNETKKILVEFILSWPATPGHAAWPGLWWLSVETFLWRALAVLSLAGIGCE